MLISQAIDHDLTIITYVQNSKFFDYDVKVLNRQLKERV